MASTPRARILPPYTRRTKDWRHHLLRLTALGAVLLFALFYGLAIAVLPQQFMTFLLLPLVALVPLVLWLAPDLDPRWDETVRFLMFAYLATTLVWPYYLAIDITGLPWMSIGRIVQAAMLITVVVFYAMSDRVRRELSEVLKAEPLMARLWLGTFFLVFISMPLNGMAGFNAGARFLVYHLGILLIAAWVFRSDSAPMTLQRLFLVCLPILGLFGWLEYVNGRPIWVDYIPPLFRIADSALLETLTRASIRTLGGEFRVRSSYGTPLFYGEYLGMMMPFAMHAVATAPTKVRQGLAAALVAFVVFSVFVCNSRSGWVALVAGTFAYYVVYVIVQYNRLREKAGYITSVAFWALPVAFVGAIIMVLTVPGLRYRVLGGGASSYSDAARDFQWANTLAAALRRPWGYGPGSSGEIAGDFKQNAVGFTVDSTQVWLLAEYGFLGLFLFAVAYLWALWVMFGVALRAESRDEQVALPAFAAMAAFLATRYGIASDANLYLVCAMMGMGLALSWRQQQRHGMKLPAGAAAFPTLSGILGGGRNRAPSPAPVAPQGSSLSHRSV